SSRRRHTRLQGDWSSDVCSSDLPVASREAAAERASGGIVSPRASSTSALPQRLETERLPCFTTGTPQAAVRSAVPVEILRLPERSEERRVGKECRTRGWAGADRK